MKNRKSVSPKSKTSSPVSRTELVKFDFYIPLSLFEECRAAAKKHGVKMGMRRANRKLYSKAEAI